MKIKQITVFLMFLILLPKGFAHAHKVIIFAWVEDGIVFSESHFGSKRKAKNCNVSVVNEKGEQVHKGITDENGNFSFKISDNIDSDLILNLDAGQGHKAFWKIRANELKTNPFNDDIKNIMEKKGKLEQSPPVYKLLLGIGIIFLLGFALKIFKKDSLEKDRLK